MPISLDPRSAVIYFDLCFESYDHDEDVAAAEQGNEEAAERLDRILKLAPDNFGLALHRTESAALAEITTMIGAVLPGHTVNNEGHDRFDNLIVKVGVDTLAEAKALMEFVHRRAGGGDDCIYLDTPYFAVQGFRLYPQGVNADAIELHELDEAVADGRIAA